MSLFQKYEIKGIITGLFVGIAVSILVQLVSPLVEMAILKSIPDIGPDEISKIEREIVLHPIYILFYIGSNFLIIGLSSLSGYCLSFKKRKLAAIVCALPFMVFVLFNKNLFQSNFVLYIATLIACLSAFYIAIFYGTKICSPQINERV